MTVVECQYARQRKGRAGTYSRLDTAHISTSSSSVVQQHHLHLALIPTLSVTLLLLSIFLPTLVLLVRVIIDRRWRNIRHPFQHRFARGGLCGLKAGEDVEFGVQLGLRLNSLCAHVRERRSSVFAKCEEGEEEGSKTHLLPHAVLISLLHLQHLPFVLLHDALPCVRFGKDGVHLRFEELLVRGTLACEKGRKAREGERRTAERKAESSSKRALTNSSSPSSSSDSSSAKDAQSSVPFVMLEHRRE
jgi:hypothetical protein